MKSPATVTSTAGFRNDRGGISRRYAGGEGSPGADYWARIIGYRAPSFSITKDSLWAFEILIELGFRYDSSIFPVDHPNYGMPRGPRTPFRVPTARGTIVEFPMPTLELGGARSPFGGGAYLRLLPYWYTRWGIRFLNEREGQPACVYVHPWEIDTGQPRMKGSVTARMRHYLGLRGLETKLRGLLRDFNFQTMGALIGEMEQHPPRPQETDCRKFPWISWKKSRTTWRRARSAALQCVRNSP